MKTTLITLTFMIGAYCLTMATRQLIKIIQENARYTRWTDWILAIIGQVIMILGVIGITILGIVTINQLIS